MTPQVEDDPAESPGVFPESGVRSRSYVVGRDEGMKGAVAGTSRVHPKNPAVTGS